VLLDHTHIAHTWCAYACIGCTTYDIYIREIPPLNSRSRQLDYSSCEEDQHIQPQLCTHHNFEIVMCLYHFTNWCPA